MSDTTGVLIIDDDPGIHRTLTRALAPTCSVGMATSGEEGLQRYEQLCPDVVLLDVMLPQMTGIAVLRALKRMRGDLPVIMMTAYAEVQTAVQAIKLGATDYIQKPLDADAVLRQIGHVVRRAGAKRETIHADVIGRSAAMMRIRRLVESFGPTDIPVLLQGETGTGKGLIAAALHKLSKRAQAPFVGIDCATLPEQLAESELFGYEDGAFTGAGRKKRGRVAFADGGTLFLDEIGTLSIATQAKLLTLIEQQSFVPLGTRSLQPTQIDVRFIGATNVSLQRAVDERTFRADLYHRLNGISIELPPLRDRDNDVELLARHFIAEYGPTAGKPDLDLGMDALDALRSYRWPGNVRELQRVMAAAVVLADGVVTADDLPQHVRASRVAAPPTAGMVSTPIDLRQIKECAGREAQKRVIQELQQRTNMSRQELARMLGIDPKTLRSLLKEIADRE
jgi:two-component system, NtrC family, response regulator AtoC